MERYVETFFRFKWLFLLVLIIVPALGIGYTFKERQVLYLSTGTVWAEKPAYLSVSSDWNQWNTPAENQVGNVQEFLQTDSFALDVLKQTALRSNLATAQEQLKTLDNLRKRVNVAPVGVHLLAVSYADPQPVVAQQVVQAIIATFNQEVLATATGTDSVTLAFYQKKLDDANVQAVNTIAALRTYLDAHPEIARSTTPQNVSSLIANATFEAQHPELVRLIQAQSSAASQQQELQKEVDQIQFNQSSQTVGTQQSFRTMDPPLAPTQPESTKRKMALQIGIATGAALGFVVVGLVILTLMDTTLRSPTVAASRLHLPIYASVPLLRERRSWFRRRRVRRRNVRALLALQARLPELVGRSQATS